MLPLILKNWFLFCYNIHHHSATSSMKCNLHKKSFRTYNSGNFSFTVSAIDSWVKMQDQMGEIALKDLRPSKIKWLLNGYCTDLLFFTEFLLLLCEYTIMSIVLFHLYNPVFLNHTKASRKLNIYDE